MKKTILLPVETEREMQDARENRVVDGELMPFTNGTEKSYVRDKVKEAQINGRIGDKMLMVVNPLYLHIPRWQRELRIGEALKIGNNYDPSRWGTPKVILINNQLYCVDGQHRIYGAFKAGIEFVVVEFLDITENHAIDIFLGQTKERTSMTPSDYLKAAIQGEKPDYIKFRKLCKESNVRIKGDDADFCKNPIGIFTPISDGIKMTRNDPELLERILKLLGKLQWNGTDYANGKAYSAKVIRVLKKLYAYYNGMETEMEKCLIDNCKGAEFFKNVLYQKGQETLFDYLAMVLENNIGKVTTFAVAETPKRAPRTKKAN